MTRIEFVIDELVLHGVEPHRRHLVADAVQRELSRLAVRDVMSQLGVSAAHGGAQGAHGTDVSGAVRLASTIAAPPLSNSIRAAVTRAVASVASGAPGTAGAAAP